MKVLLASMPATGHFNPLLVVARTLKKAGHEPIIYSGQLFRDQAEVAGIPFFPLPEEADQVVLDKIAGRTVIAPAMTAPEDRSPRLNALVQRSFGWTRRAGLDGGCAVAAGLFEPDDHEGPAREHLLAMEKRWRDLLAEQVRRSIQLNHFLKEVDVDQFVWELCGIYLSHHASYRFVRDPKADKRAAKASDALLRRFVSESDARARKPRKRRSRQ
jgi:hypothetical protein